MGPARNAPPGSKPPMSALPPTAADTQSEAAGLPSMDATALLPVVKEHLQTLAREWQGLSEEHAKQGPVAYGSAGGSGHAAGHGGDDGFILITPGDGPSQVRVSMAGGSAGAGTVAGSGGGGASNTSDYHRGFAAAVTKCRQALVVLLEML